MIYDYRYTVDVTDTIKPRLYQGADGTWAGRWGPRSAKGTEAEVLEWAWSLPEVLQ